MTHYFFRLDFTSDSRYTLSRPTEEILDNLDEVITVTAYFSEELPPQLMSNKRDFEDQLIEYEKRSDGNIVYRFISPNETEELEQEAQQAGIRPVIVNVQERDQVQQLRAYMGAVLEKGSKKEVIPVVQPGASMEYTMTSTIKKLIVEEKPKVALLQGHGEASLEQYAQVNGVLSVLYSVEPYTIGEGDIPNTYRTLAIINPTDTFSTEGHIKIRCLSWARRKYLLSLFLFKSRIVKSIFGRTKKHQLEFMVEH